METEGTSTAGGPGGDGGPGVGPARETGGPPAWIRTIPPSEADGDLAEAYEEIGARGSVAHVIGVHSLHPEALRDHVRLYRTLMFRRSPLSRAERESVAVVVSTLNDCFY